MDLLKSREGRRGRMGDGITRRSAYWPYLSAEIIESELISPQYMLFERI